MMKPYLARIDANTTGNRNDVTPLFADRESFSQLADDLAQPFEDAGIDAVVAIDALGFILGTAIAERLGVGLVPARKEGKLPVKTIQEAFVDYSGGEKSLEMRPDALKPGMSVLIVDEWVETGAHVKAAIALAERLGARVSGIAAICMDRNESTSELRRQYTVCTVWDDEQGRSGDTNPISKPEFQDAPGVPGTRCVDFREAPPRAEHRSLSARWPHQAMCAQTSWRFGENVGPREKAFLPARVGVRFRHAGSAPEGACLTE